MTTWSDRGLSVITLGLGEQGEYVAETERSGQRHYHVLRLPWFTGTILPDSAALQDELPYALSMALRRAQGGVFGRDLSPSPGAALWLDFRPPAGILPALPWETALQQVFNVPVFRLPRHEILPLADMRSLSAAVYVDAAGAPAAAAILEQLKDMLCGIAACAAKSEINVFADHDTVSRLTSGDWAPFGPADPGHLYTVNAYPLDPAVPWATQVQSVRPAEPIDLLIIAAPAFFNNHRPSLLLSIGPDQKRRPVSPEEIAACATKLGAWSIGVIGASADGGRMLAHELAAARPGPVVAAPLPGRVGEMYRRLLTGQPEPVSWRDQTVGAASAYVHPDGASASSPEVEPTAGDQSRQAQVLSVLGTATLGSAVTAPGVPRWLASNQRVLEMFAEPLLRAGPDDPVASARRTGYAAGMETMSRALAAHWQGELNEQEGELD
jgi:hypothetical protein